MNNNPNAGMFVALASRLAAPAGFGGVGGLAGRFDVDTMPQPINDAEFDPTPA